MADRLRPRLRDFRAPLLSAKGGRVLAIGPTGRAKIKAGAKVKERRT